MPGQLFVFSAPSGTGKSSIIQALVERTADLAYSISHTTRKPRGAEQNGVHYHFVDRDRFEKMAEEGEFVEWAPVYQDLYGTSRESLSARTSEGTDVVLDLDVQGAMQIKARCGHSRLIFILPPSLEELERRLRDRGTDSEDVIRKRVAAAQEEISHCPDYDHIIINDDLEKAVREAQAVVTAARSRTPRRMDEVARRFRIPRQGNR